MRSSGPINYHGHFARVCSSVRSARANHLGARQLPVCALMVGWEGGGRLLLLLLLLALPLLLSARRRSGCLIWGRINRARLGQISSVGRIYWHPLAAALLAATTSWT